MRGSVRILGIDPGSRVTGFGVIDWQPQKQSLVDAGVIRTGSGEFNARLECIFDGIRNLVERVQPNCVAIEDVFMHKNAASALKLGAARSAAICATFGSDVTLAEYSPRRIKQAVSGFGGADKQQVHRMMCTLLQADATLPTDATDALAVAFCHGSTMKLPAAMQIQHGART
ncbi:MAG: crossover junction endodeoxyribonuclease RuvC [Pseudomonadota bacterium]